jgi:hypothetical protein
MRTSRKCIESTHSIDIADFVDLKNIRVSQALFWNRRRAAKACDFTPSAERHRQDRIVVVISNREHLASVKPMIVFDSRADDFASSS